MTTTENKDFRRSYNKFYSLYRFQMSNIDKEDWHRIFYEKNVAKSLYELKYISDKKTKADPYKFYFLMSCFWFIKTNYRSLNNTLRLSKSKIISVIVILAAATTLLLNLGEISKRFQSWRNDTNQNQSLIPKEKLQSIKTQDDKVYSKPDSAHILKTDSLTKNLNETKPCL